MPNPYHDDQGRFCSAGEMSASIARLTEKGDYYTAQKMNEEFNRYQIIGAKAPDSVRVAELKNKLMVSANAEGNLALSIIATQDASNADIAQAIKEVKAEEAEAEKSMTSIKDKQDKINSEIATATNNQYRTAAELEDAVIKDKIAQAEAKREILDTLTQKMIDAGIPRNYAKSYLERKSPELGFGDYVNTFNNKVVRSEPAHPVTAESKVWNSVTRPAEYKTIIQGVVATAEKEGVFNQYNNNLEAVKQRGTLEAQHSNQYYELSREAFAAEQASIKRNIVISRLQKVQEWRKTLKTHGVSEYATLVPARGIQVSKITKDTEGKINNLQGLTPNGEIERIVKVAPSDSGQPGTGVLVGENNGKYYSQTHYANYKTNGSDKYVIFDPTVKGMPYFEGNSEIKTFYSEIDSGD